MSTELAPFGITVNMISPGWIPVERHKNDPPEQKAAYLATVPAGRWGIPDDLGGIVTLLASDAGSFISGQEYLRQWRTDRRMRSAPDYR